MQKAPENKSSNRLKKMPDHELYALFFKLEKSIKKKNFWSLERIYPAEYHQVTNEIRRRREIKEAEHAKELAKLRCEALEYRDKAAHHELSEVATGLSLDRTAAEEWQSTGRGEH